MIGQEQRGDCIIPASSDGGPVFAPASERNDSGSKVEGDLASIRADANGTATGFIVAPDVTQWKAGDLVCALTPGGGYAEYCAVPAPHCLPVPKGLSLQEAAALPENFYTVWTNVFDRGGLKADRQRVIRPLADFERAGLHDPSGMRRQAPRFETDDVLDHPTFGIGLVQEVTGDKMRVAFKADTKLLVHGKA